VRVREGGARRRGRVWREGRPAPLMRRSERERIANRCVCGVGEYL